MKKFYFIICLLLMVSVCGCSKSVEVTPNQDLVLDWDGVTISYQGNPITISSHKGFSCEIKTDVGLNGNYYNISIDNARDVTSLTLNNNNILEENMDKLKDMFYYTEYLGTMMTGARSLGNDTWIVGQCACDGVPAELAAQNLYSYLTTIPVTANQLYVKCGDAFTFGSPWSQNEARPDKCLVVHSAQVLPYKVELNMEPSVLVDANGVSNPCEFGQTEAYDYYYYGGFTIQVAKGLDVSEFISFTGR